MANLAQRLRQELTEDARNDEVCRDRLMDWVAAQFKAGNNPVIIYCSTFLKLKCKEWENIYQPMFPTKVKEYLAHIERDKEGRYILNAYQESGYGKESIDVTGTDLSIEYAPDGVDEQRKRLFLESEGFRVVKSWRQHLGNILEIYY